MTIPDNCRRWAWAKIHLSRYGISGRIEQATCGTFQVKPGSLFPALHRMQEQGWLFSEWGASGHGRRAKYYRITKAGLRQLETEKERWGRVAIAMASALQAQR